MGNLSTSVRQLIDEGHMFIEVNDSLVQAALVAWQRLIAQFKDLPEGFLITRKGERESDLGLIFRLGGVGYDYKYFFHLAHDFCNFMSQLEKQQFGAYEEEFHVIEALRKHLNEVAFQIASKLDDKHSHLFLETLLPNLRTCTRCSTPYATTTLRSLWYPPAPTQKGARVHIDRCFFAVHVGDSGGALFGYDNEQGENARPVSPPLGHAVVFFGVKALYLSDGRVSPLWHGSTVDEGRDRLAMVQFVQADIGFEVPKASDAYKAFYKNREH